MCIIREKGETEINLDHYHAIAMGPGLGVSEESISLLHNVIETVKAPLILDADALNIISIEKELLEILPRNTIITPHIGEFDRLVGTSKNSFERYEKLINLAVNNQLIVVLKGAHTAIAIPNGQIYFNSTGNPGMATAGSGDVLTGMLLGLISQGYHAIDATILAVFLHGLSGDTCLENHSYESIIASDIVENLGKAFRLLMGKN